MLGVERLLVVKMASQGHSRSLGYVLRYFRDVSKCFSN